MTNEEAVKWLRAYPKMTDFTMPQIEEALDMAEKALMEQAQADGEHDGCKDCVYQDNPEDAMPCRECKQNYMDKWKAMPNKEGHWEVMYEPKNMVVCSECGKCAYLYNNRGSAYCPHCGDYKGEVRYDTK